MFEKEKTIVRKWAELMFGGESSVKEGYALMFADNATWTLIGTTPASGKHVGLDAIMKNLDRRFQGDGRPGSKDQGLDSEVGVKVTIKDIQALEDGRVLMLASTKAVGNNGLPYNNEYAWIFRVENDRIVDWLEYCDTVCIETAMFNKRVVPAEELPAHLR